MLVTLVATLCQLANPASCAEERFDVSYGQCTVTAQQGIADFMVNSQRYHAGWRLDNWKCFIGNPPPPKVPA